VTDNIIVRRTPTQADFDLFAEISGDDNPIHVDPDFSARTRFGRTVAHGMLLYSWCWALLRKHFPHLRPVRDSLMFPNPTFAGEELAFHLQSRDDGKVDISIVRSADNETVLTLQSELKEGTL